MGLRDFTFILLVSALISVGQISFKVAASKMKVLSIELILNPALFIAIFLYAGATILWVLVLRNVELGVAYPIISLSFVIVPLLVWLLGHEPLNLNALVGSAFICVGVAISCGVWAE